MLLFLIMVLLFVVSVWIFLQRPEFGRRASGENLERIRKSLNYRDGKFQNIHVTPNFAEGANVFSVMRKFFFAKPKNAVPSFLLPAKKTSLAALDPKEEMLVWFGHSSYFIQMNGKTILVDPVFSGAASPVSFTTRSFKGTDVYTTEDLPEIDYLFITHDHWDHLDYKTILKLKPKVKRVITGLGTAAHLDRWGYERSQIDELDWNETLELEKSIVVHTVPSRHFSGRLFRRNTSLWMSFVLETPSIKLFLGGDSGYDTHFAEAGNKFGPFDLAILECGQYNPDWKYIHIMPEEVVQAALDLKAKALLPVHWAKFSLSLHDWDEPIIKVTAEAEKRNLRVIHPMIGEAVDLHQPAEFPRWWEMES
jgi:L-ascorbate metabolism protein UlaG (beta-lactamase superfamily)